MARMFATMTAVPTQDDLAAAVALFERLSRVGICQHCGHSEVRLHGIAPDVFGHPTLICVLRPDPTMVSSSGGGGKKKHWGGPGGCTSTRVHVVYEDALGYTGVGHFLYGEPLTSFQVFEMAWCARCTSTAWDILSRTQVHLRNELGREPTAAEEREHLNDRLHQRVRGDHLRYVLDAMEDRSRDQLLEELRAARRS
jgi:hypothetical protein